MDWVAIIPARGGSKGIPGKNLAPCGGKPLLNWTVEAALESNLFDRVILSTDDEKIRLAGVAMGLEVPTLRPPELAKDETPMLPVIRHVVAEVERNHGRIKGVALLQPTSPLRTSEHLRNAFTQFLASSADALVSIVEVPHVYNPVSVLRQDKGGMVTPYADRDSLVFRRQEKPKIYARNGPAILLLNRSQIDRDSFYDGITLGFEMHIQDSVDIDSPDDLAIAEWRLSRRR